MLLPTMAEKLEKRLLDIEQVLAPPEDLGARFAGVDTKLGQIRQIMQPLHTTRFTTLVQKLNQVAAATAEILPGLTEQS